MHKFCFPARCRIRRSKEFDAVIKQGMRFSDHYFEFYLLKQNRLFSRLGIMISKRHCKYAVKRNKIRRIIRELFRQKQLTGVDLVVLLKSSITNVSIYEITQCLNEQFLPLCK